MSGPLIPCAVALGSNVGDRRAHLDEAVVEIARLPGVHFLSRSSWHETEPVGGPAGQARYLNGAVLLETSLPARELLNGLLSIEQAHGRTRPHGLRNGPRTLDLDLLVYGADQIREPGLEVPHPHVEDREFVLAPLAEIAGDLVLPRSGKRVSQRLAEIVAVPTPR
ncbi:MAG: 2-amino-4-hydroxy-6-hydroxymethyldihydropteridine diphosphokinase [Planctomycetota bacterium]